MSSGGDIDNRLKVLIDGLKMPTQGQDLGQFTEPVQGEDPFYCLPEDDGLTADLRVITDRLLLPVEDGEHGHDVELVIFVRTSVIDRTGLLHETFQ
jgi:hypothetical protein